MFELEVLRRIQRERAQHAVGIYEGLDPATKAELADLTADADIEKLPEAFGPGSEIQTAAGAFYMVIDWDAIDGDAPIG